MTELWLLLAKAGSVLTWDALVQAQRIRLAAIDRKLGMELELNDRALPDVIAATARTIEEVDRSLRLRLAGRPAEEVAQAARKALAERGVVLPEEDLSIFARAVADDSDFRFPLT